MSYHWPDSVAVMERLIEDAHLTDEEVRKIVRERHRLLPTQPFGLHAGSPAAALACRS